MHRVRDNSCFLLREERHDAYRNKLLFLILKAAADAQLFLYVGYDGCTALEWEVITVIACPIQTTLVLGHSEHMLGGSPFLSGRF